MKNVDRISTMPLLGLYINTDGQLIEPTQELAVSGLKLDPVADQALIEQDEWEDEDFTHLNGPSNPSL